MTFDWLRRRVGAPASRNVGGALSDRSDDTTKPCADPALAGESKRAGDNELDQRLERDIAQHQARDAIVNAAPVDVAANHRARMTKIAAFVAQRHGGDTPRVRFFMRPAGSRVNGACFGDGVIWLAADLEGEKSAGVAIHAPRPPRVGSRGDLGRDEGPARRARAAG